MIQLQPDVTVEEASPYEGKPNGIRLRDTDTGDVIILRPAGIIKLVEYLENLVK